MAVVEVRDIRKHFDEVHAVNGVDFSIQDGELLVILGPSGCGKTTLMRMIAGLEKPTTGDIIIAGQVVTDLPPRDRKIAMVFQSYALYPHMTVFDNIAFPLKAQQFPKQEIKRKVEAAAATLGIERLLNRKPRQLSGGERQRVALCRALVKEPRVMLLDEPLSNLDAKLRASARDELQRFQRRTGITTLFVTHDQVEAMGLGDRIVVMNAGKVRQIGTPQQVYHDSADTFVATFLGSPGMNLMDWGDYLLGFRPEQFVPKATIGVHDNLATFAFRVNRVEYLGADQLVYGVLERAGDQLVYGVLEGAADGVAVVSKLNSELHIQLEVGERYSFIVQQQQLRFFNKETGLRMEPRQI